MKKYPSVTVLVTVKNSVNTIKKCVDSLLTLDYPNKKILIIDAFSTDGTYEVLKKYAKKIQLSRVKGNAPKTYNWALRRIKTDLIAFTDADCTVKKNWLKELVKPFKDKHIIASAGFCKTPKNVNRLQRMIGIELENRFKHFQKFISRAPTMNLCVRTEIVKKIKFDERLNVAFDTDFGYRLTKLGKMVYVPKAIVYHYHRSIWRSFFKQQFRYARATPLLYLKHKRRSVGDHISRPMMILQEFTFLLACLFLIISIFNTSSITLVFVLFAILFLLYFIDIFSLTKNISDILLFFALFFFRNIAWIAGLLFGIADLFKL